MRVRTSAGGRMLQDASEQKDTTNFELESLSLRALRVKARVWRYETFHLALRISGLFPRVFSAAHPRLLLYQFRNIIAL